MKTTVIYHSADYDGIFCREIARKFLPDAELIGWNFGDPLIPMPSDGDVYIVDLSPDCLSQVKAEGLGRIIWIDHHKTSIDKWEPHNLRGYRIDGVAACRLAWQWFLCVDGNTPVRPPKTSGVSPAGVLPQKLHFIFRAVDEPAAVRLAGEYDVWDKRDPMAETLQYGLRTLEPTPADWDDLLSMEMRSIISSLLDEGDVAQRYAQKNDASICRALTWLMEWEGLQFLCINTARFNSLFFAARDLPETGHDALLGFCWNGNKWAVSLYHASHRTDLDLSEIAKKHGGGGHRGACGFTCKELPFTL